jgi:hypothetical protein
MNKLIQIIEQFDSGHFNRRGETLEKMREKAKELGFFPLPLTQNDIECFWIRIEAKDVNRKHISVTFESFEDDSYLVLLRDYARYEPNKPETTEKMRHAISTMEEVWVRSCYKFFEKNGFWDWYQVPKEKAFHEIMMFSKGQGNPRLFKERIEELYKAAGVR